MEADAFDSGQKIQQSFVRIESFDGYRLTITNKLGAARSASLLILISDIPRFWVIFCQNIRLSNLSEI